MNKGDERSLYRKWAIRIFVKMEWVYLCKDNLVATLHALAKISYKDNWHELYYYKIIGLLTFLVIIPNVTEPRNFETFFFTAFVLKFIVAQTRYLIFISSNLLSNFEGLIQHRRATLVKWRKSLSQYSSAICEVTDAVL